MKQWYLRSNFPYYKALKKIHKYGRLIYFNKLFILYQLITKNSNICIITSFCLRIRSTISICLLIFHALTFTSLAPLIFTSTLNLLLCFNSVFDKLRSISWSAPLLFWYICCFLYFYLAELFVASMWLGRIAFPNEIFVVGSQITTF